MLVTLTGYIDVDADTDTDDDEEEEEKEVGRGGGGGMGQKRIKLVAQEKFCFNTAFEKEMEAIIKFLNLTMPKHSEYID